MVCLRSWVLGPNLCLSYQFWLRTRGSPSTAVARATSLQLTEPHLYVVSGGVNLQFSTSGYILRTSSPWPPTKTHYPLLTTPTRSCPSTPMAQDLLQNTEFALDDLGEHMKGFQSALLSGLTVRSDVGEASYQLNQDQQGFRNKYELFPPEVFGELTPAHEDLSRCMTKSRRLATKNTTIA